LESSNPQSDLPFFQELLQGGVASTKEDIYIIGGYYSTADQIVKMNATSEAYEYLVVHNNPLPVMNVWMNAPTTVYVEKLNRIYFFGGLHVVAWTWTPVSLIWYVDL